MRTFLRNNGLTLVVFGLFLGVMVGQALVGHRDYNNQRQQKGEDPVGLRQYLTTGHFLEATGENWESEFLQMGMFVILTAFLFQKGSPESKDPDSDEPDPVDADPRLSRNDPKAPWPVRRGGGWVLWVYSNSLGLAFLLLFLASFCLHAGGGVRHYNEERLEEGQSAVSVWQYLASARFWFESLQNWQSEFLAIAAMVYLSVFLRQKGSAESKPVAAPHWESGEESPVERAEEDKLSQVEKKGGRDDEPVNLGGVPAGVA